MIKAYFINGFLEAGKTTFIKDLLQQDVFTTNEPTLLLLCEEGEEEYDRDWLAEHHIMLAQIDTVQDFTPEHIAEVTRDFCPTRVFVEYNCMWGRKNIAFPWQWNQPVEIVLFNAETFEVYAKNMRSLVAEQTRYAAMAVFNRCDNVMEKLPSFMRNLLAVNPGIAVAFEGKDGEINPRFKEELPYDISAEELTIKDKTYAVFYLDAMEDVERYLHKQVILTAKVMKKATDKPNMLILGRYVMTCCMADLTLFGFICDYEHTDELNVEDWVSIQAIVEKEYAEKYQLWYPTLRIISCQKTAKPEKEVVDIL